ncbi:General transcription factor IIH subunit 3 [Morus notabilis]|uniref:General transcription and DNA repair factor IIH subunit TFB4 n=1 Tax=Morus notabilis TaxID=981085 RepID=W9QNF6_9ROSA|nr:General transcription factor IIH subunit 3 [Morus notabilis]
MASAPSKLYADDVSLLMVLLDTNPLFWSTSSLPFSNFLSHVLSFLNSILLLNQLNQVAVIATGYNSCDYIFDSSVSTSRGLENGRMPALCSNLLQKLEEFVVRDEQLCKEGSENGLASSLLSGYVAIMNAIFSAQRSMVPIDSCYLGSNNSAFLQQASYITGGVYLKPQQPDGLFQYLSTVFATDLHSRTFLQLPKSVGVDFRASKEDSRKDGRPLESRRKDSRKNDPNIQLASSV